jgi:hypothetical protein
VSQAVGEQLRWDARELRAEILKSGWAAQQIANDE